MNKQDCLDSLYVSMLSSMLLEHEKQWGPPNQEQLLTMDEKSSKLTQQMSNAWTTKAKQLKQQET